MLACALLLGLLLPLARVKSAVDGLQEEVVNPVDVLLGECLDYRPKGEWWSYQWCYKDYVEQHHYDRHPISPAIVHPVGDYKGELQLDAETWSQTHQHDEPDCEIEGSTDIVRRTATVQINCCIVDHSNPSKKLRRNTGDVLHSTFIESVTESSPCNYLVTVCTELTCSEETKADIQKQIERNPQQNALYHNIQRAPSAQKKEKVKTRDRSRVQPKDKKPKEEGEMPSSPDFKYSFTSENNQPVSKDEQEDLKNRVKEMFYHGYNSYMDNAFPAADLKPISCTGGKFDLIKIPLVTLIDTLDTLVVLQNYSEFKRAVNLIDKEMPSFDFDVNISVFETTIRILGGLVSAHLMAIDPKIGIYSEEGDDVYNGCLLRLATDMGNRLLPAFDTSTGIPYGTVNLRSGVPKGETELASTAGAGSLVIEFEVLSCLTGDDTFGEAARQATEALFDRRSDLSLVGKHIHIRTGKWHETLSGVGSNSDSFYEYLLKAYLLFRRKEYYFMFQEVFQAVKDHSLQQNVWFNDVDMFSGKVRTRRSESLQAFWPGLEALLGMTHSSSNLLNAFYLVLKDFEFLPEEFDYVQWDIDKKKGSSVYYPLRPELIESTYMHFMTTRDRSWLIAGRSFLQAIESHARTECGYAAIKDITVMEMDDDMPSYFLSETCKYMYLLFDEENPFHDRHYIFSTEAHPFDTLQLGDICASPSHISNYEQGILAQQPSDADRDVYVLFNSMMASFDSIDAELADIYVEPSMEGQSDGDNNGYSAHINVTNHHYHNWKEGKVLHQELLKCPKTAWWSYQSYHLPESSHSDNIEKKLFRSKKSKEAKKNAKSITENKNTKSHAGNLFDILKSLSSQIQSVANGRDPFSHAEDSTSSDEDLYDDEDDPLAKCSIFDDPNRAMNKAVDDDKVDGNAVELNVGALGSFSVHIFSDGFVINSHLFGNTMEISGIGQPSMFVKEYNQSHSSAVVALKSGEIATCDVHLDVSWGPFADGETIWKAKNYNQKYAPAELMKKRSCSFAAFGPTSNHVTFPSKTIVGPMTRLKSKESCHPPEQEKDLDEHMLSDSEGIKVSGSYDGTVVVADRGSCMFEEKTIAAENAGAEAVVIVNSEPALFMMAGLAQVKEEDPPKMLSSVPTVMVTSTDGEFLTEAVDYLSSKGMTASVSVDIVGLPAVLDTRLMGYSDHPAIRMSDKLIHIHGLGAWSSLLTMSPEGQWQLFIVPSSDLTIVTPWNVLTSQGQPYCTNSDFSLDPVQTYLRLTQEKCPSAVVIQKDTRLIEVKKKYV